MSIVPMPQVRPNRSQGPWDRRDVAELSQTSFRTTLRGFDRDEVRAILESVAADYRVLQLQNASLQRQLADLEAVLQAYHRGDGPANGTALTPGHVLQRANDEARTILMDAQVKAEQTMARVAARAREAERPIEQLEEDQRNFRALLGATVSELLGVLSMTHRHPSAGHDDPRQIAGTLLVETSASAPAAGTGLAQ
ncbi:MAG: DivIVA domain-containing protein, partial [Acidobacteria bacterium]